MNPCACLGPREDEPYCMCGMISRGLKTEADYKTINQEADDRLSAALEKIFDFRNKNANNSKTPASN